MENQRCFPFFAVIFFMSFSTNLLSSETPDGWDWSRPQAEILPEGDLKWAPREFDFKSNKHGSIRYIDYDAGDDSNSGLSKESPWKHHPWDKNAAGKSKECSGIHCYVFKRGSIYRGSLTVREAGEKGNPIFLTSDPSWGSGEASLHGSEKISGWKKGGHSKMPESEKVWRAEIHFLSRLVCIVSKDGKTERLKLARTPNWNPANHQDYLQECWSWENPEWWKPGKYKRALGGSKVLVGRDSRHLTKDEDFYRDAIVWTEWGIVMGAPYASKIEKFDPASRELYFSGPWYGDSGQINTNHRYWLEDKAQFLDEPGEFWVEDTGNGSGILYLRLPGDADPSSVTIEAAKHVNLIEDLASSKAPARIDILSPKQKAELEKTGARHLKISGLSFRFCNPHWRLDDQVWMHKNADSACIRFLGACKDVEISNCRFEEVPKAIRIDPIFFERRVSDIRISDNEIISADHGGISVSAGAQSFEAKTGTSLGDVKILRNSLKDIGFRPVRPNGQVAISVNFPETALISGNIVEHCGGAGIFVFGGKGNRESHHVPFNRIVIHNNKVLDSLMIANDWGGIETWQGGPFYVYGNISGNALGPMNWGGKTFGHAYYLDGSFKNYLFNNIAFGKSNDLKNLRYANCSAFQEIHSYQNSFFNNTAYKFLEASRRQAPHAGRDKFISNIFDDASKYVFRHSDKEGQDPNAKDAGAHVEDFNYPTNAFSKNVFYGITGKTAVFEAYGGDYASPKDFSEALSKKFAMASDVGILCTEPPLANPEKGDFRLSKQSAAIGMGSKVFVPWARYDTVAEWNFFPDPSNPCLINDEHWNMKPQMNDRETYYKSPFYPLVANKASSTDYISGILEDWICGALKLDGKEQYLKMELPKNPQDFDPQISKSSFTIECVVKIESASNGILAEKMDENGWRLSIAKNGRLSFTVKSGELSKVLLSQKELNNSTWCHIVAECDRKEKQLRLFIDGKFDSSSDGIGEDASLAGNSALYVGGTPAGGNLSASLDFLRISRGSLSDAKTTVEELYAWEFDGPSNCDFNFRATPTNLKRDAGAIQK